VEAFSVPKEYAEKLRELGFGFGGKLSPMEVIFLNEFGIAPVYSGGGAEGALPLGV